RRVLREPRRGRLPGRARPGLPRRPRRLRRRRVPPHPLAGRAVARAVRRPLGQRQDRFRPAERRRRPAGRRRRRPPRSRRSRWMSRPGLVLEVDERTPPILVHEGEGFRLERFPLGTRVIYPPDSLPGIRDVNGRIREALLNPLGSEPLPELLRPGMRLTIVFDDLSLPLPPMRAPDVRQRVI